MAGKVTRKQLASVGRGNGVASVQAGNLAHERKSEPSAPRIGIQPMERREDAFALRFGDAVAVIRNL